MRVNNIVKRIGFIIVIFVFCFSYSLNVNAVDEELDDNGYQIVIDDGADIFTESEESLIYSKMIPIKKYGNVVLKTTNMNKYQSTGYYAEMYYYNKFGNQSGTIFLIDMNNRMIYIFSDGEIYKTITKSRALTITDNVYQYASKGNYYECASVAFEQIEALMENKKIEEPMKYTSNALIALIVSFMFYLIVFGSKTEKEFSGKLLFKNKYISSETINNKDDIKFRLKEEPSITKVRERRKFVLIRNILIVLASILNTSGGSSGDSSSGGGSSGGGSSGGSSGGGGGHSF